MAIVTSDDILTVIILESKDETEALITLLDIAPPDVGVVLDELTNALVGAA